MGNEINYKISVIVITYNQEKLIRRALDSVLIQKDWGLYEIIVCDDCSTDHNWDVIIQYAKQYPEIIKPFKSGHNLGIFGNLESTWRRPLGDLIIYLAGDDEICNGLFEKVYQFVKKEKLNVIKGSFCIYTDSKIILSNGKEKLRSNRLISKGYDAVSLKIRGLVGSSRGIFYSKELISRFKSPNKNIGIYTDGLYDIQVQLYSDRNYYINFVGGIYYAGIGVSSKTSFKDHQESILLFYNEIENDIVYNLNKKDRYYILFKKEYINFYNSPNLNSYIKMLNFYLKSLVPQYGISIREMIEIFIFIFIRLIIYK
jgi:glycosyltransferase involved in cell wall biosynthesis